MVDINLLLSRQLMQIKLNFRSLPYWFNHIFFVFGVLFVSAFLHELTHHLITGCDFVAGFYDIEGRMGAGATFCQGPFYSEPLAYLITFSFAFPLCYLKILLDNKYRSYEK